MIGIRDARQGAQGMDDALKAAVAKIAPGHRQALLALALELGRRHPHPASSPALRLVRN